ncbi:MAG TPA: polysaccharide deacetylase family protein [Candidatus Dormibacteraeota bacterium]|nr:polysaccharide deacetylase family protein [Candidatus Dormibacteraeota bacterium]
MAAGQSRMKHILASRLGLSGPVVLLYHGMGAPQAEPVFSGERKYWVSAEQFASQLTMIREQGLSTISLGEVCHDHKVPQQPTRRISLTFDDGRASDYAVAFPLLKQGSFRATFFLNTAWIGRAGYLSWSQIAEMKRAGMSFESHGHEHVYLTRLPSSALNIQLRVSKQILEDRLCQPVNFLAAPYGDVNRGVIRAALAAGYKFVCTSWNWPARAGASTVNRVAIYHSTTADEFARLLQGNLSCYTKRATRAALLHLPKRVRLHFQPLHSTARIAEEHA